MAISPSLALGALAAGRREPSGCSNAPEGAGARSSAALPLPRSRRPWRSTHANPELALGYLHATCALVTGQPRSGAVYRGPGNGRRHPGGTGPEGVRGPPGWVSAPTIGPRRFEIAKEPGVSTRPAQSPRPKSLTTRLAATMGSRALGLSPASRSSRTAR